MPVLQPDSLHHLVASTCEALGSRAEEAQLVADQLVNANLAGHDSHGVGMLPAYVAGALGGRLIINQEPEVVTDTGALVVLDGHQGFGQVNGYRTMAMGIERAREHGAVVTGLRNSFHIGRIGHWAEQCAAGGMASMHFVNVIGHPPIVAAFGGSEAAFGTNPFCAAVPAADGKPAALLDMATSVIAMGKARVALNKGEPVPEGTLVDDAGHESTDPSIMFERPMRGALVAFGDHKGSGLAIMCELLGAALLGGETAQPENARDGRIINNMLSVIIDPSAIGSLDSFRDEVAKYHAHITGTRARAGTDRVLMPGQPEDMARAARADGFDVDGNTLKELRSSAAAAGVDDGLIAELLG